MNWLILILLLPAILVPIVLLCGFAGCGTILNLDLPTTTAPTRFLGIAGTNKIVLSWRHSSSIANFTVTRTPPDAPDPPKVVVKDTLEFSVLDADLPDASDFTYSLTAGDSAAVALKVTTLPNAPRNPTATPESATQIKLTWDHTTTSANIRRIFFIIKDTSGASPNPTFFETDPDTFTQILTVAPGSEHEFQVAAVVDGFEDSINKRIFSDFSVPPVPGRPLTTPPPPLKFIKAFPAAPVTLGVPAAAAGLTIVQIIDDMLLSPSGAFVKLRIRASSAGPTHLSSVFISRVASADPDSPNFDPMNPNPQAFDSVPPMAPGGLTEVKFAGASGVRVPAGEFRDSDETAFALDASQQLLIAFDVAADSALISTNQTLAGTREFDRPGVAAGTPNRDPAFEAGRSDPALLCIEQIEVSVPAP